MGAGGDNAQAIDIDNNENHANIQDEVRGETRVHNPDTKSDKWSEVWTHMTTIPSTNNEKAKCNYCTKIFSANTNNGTSHLWRHVKKCMARRRNVDIRSFCIGSKVEPNGTQSIALKDQIVDFDEIRKAICMFVSAGAHSFSIVEEPGFKYMISRLCPAYTVMSRHTIRRDILKLYDDERKVVEMDLRKAPGRIAFTSDNWRNDSTQDEYICITAHWIDCEWKLQKRIIRFGALAPPFDGVNIGDDVSICLNKWNIVDKVTSFTLDHATYNNVMIMEIKRQLLKSGNELLFDGQFFQIRCCCHIINLIVHDGLKLLDGVVDKIRSIAKHFKHSIPKKKKFYEVAHQIYHLDAKKRLRGDCVVRWNSTYLMLDRALYFRRVIDHVIGKDKDLMQHILSEEGWNKVATIHKFLKTFCNITNDFSASKTPTSNIYFKGVWEMESLLLEVISGPHEYLVDMVKLMQKKFDKYWNDYNKLLSCACVLDPRYKIDFVEYCYASLYGEQCGKEKTNEVLVTLGNLLKEYNQVGKQGGPCNGGNVEVNISLGKNGRMDNFDSWMSKRAKVQIEKSELDLYLEEKNHDHNAQLDVLDFWKRVSSNFPQLSALARDILAIPISSVPSESAFSMGKKLINPWRGSLKSLTIESLACYEDWLRAKGFSLRSSIVGPDQDEGDDEYEV